MVKFSIVIPLYNKKHHIYETLNSVFSQTFHDYEVILVDDGSTDGSLSEVTAFNEPNFVIIRQKNSGVSVARNRGIREAKGKYIAFLDADDIWYSNYLEEINALIEQYPNAGFYVTAYDVELANKTIKSNDCGISRGYLDSYWRTLDAKYDFVWTSATVVARNLVLAAGSFTEGEIVGQDLDLWARVAQINKTIAFSSKSCVKYNRTAENNARTRVKIAYPHAFMGVLEDQLKHACLNSKEKSAIESKYRKKMIVYIFTTIVNGDRRQARRILKDWCIGRSNKIAYMLYIASYLPKSINEKVYALRLRLF